MEGRYSVEFIVLSSTFGGHLQYRSAKLRIAPKCKQGTCDVVMDGHIQEDKFSVRLAHTAMGYAGVVKGQFATCNGAPNTDTWTFRITPNKMDLIQDEWIVTRWEGRWERSSTEGPCLLGSERTVMRGNRS